MTTTKSVVFRELGLAVSHASCESQAALDSAIEHAQRALRALRDLRAEVRPWMGERAGVVEHVSKPLARALERVKQGGEG